MPNPVLSRYLDPELLTRLADRRFHPRWLVEGNLAGAHKSPLAGFAVEFAGHREYVPGDDPKHIDWRVYYNRDKYFVKQYEMETNLVCHLVLDISGSMRYGEGAEQKVLAAARLAVVLGYAILRHSDKIAFATIDHEVRSHLPPSDSFSQIVRMTEMLDDVAANDQTDLGGCLNNLAARFGRREIVIVFSDFFGDLNELEAAIQRLRYQHHEVILFHIMHHDELHLDLEGLTRFEGLESPQTVVADPYELRVRYGAAVHEFTASLRNLAERNAGEYVLVETRRSFAEVLADYLQRRG